MAKSNKTEKVPRTKLTRVHSDKSSAKRAMKDAGENDLLFEVVAKGHKAVFVIARSYSRARAAAGQHFGMTCTVITDDEK